MKKTTIEMINKLPVYERKSVIIQGILEAYAIELNKLQKEITRIKNNLFIDSMDEEAITINERDFDIKLNNKLTIEEKRNRVSVMWQSIFGSITKEKLINLMKLITLSENIDIKKTDILGIFEITIEVHDDIKDYEELDHLLDVKFPAHLMYYINTVFRRKSELETQYTEDKYALIFCGELQTGEYPHYIESTDIVANMEYEEVYTQDDTVIIQVNERTTGDTRDFNLGGAE